MFVFFVKNINKLTTITRKQEYIGGKKKLMTDTQITKLIDTLTKIADELAELNKNVSYLKSCANLTVSDVRRLKEPQAQYHE